jgi:hypothetical protein
METPSMIKGINSSFSPIEIPKGVPAFGKKKNKKPENTVELNDYDYLCRKTIDMSYAELAQLEVLSALNSITTQEELNEFKDLLAHYFADKAQKAIDALWDEGVINEKTIEEWGKEHMRTPYHYEAHRS